MMKKTMMASIGLEVQLHQDQESQCPIMDVTQMEHSAPVLLPMQICAQEKLAMARYRGTDQRMHQLMEHAWQEPCEELQVLSNSSTALHEL